MGTVLMSTRLRSKWPYLGSTGSSRILGAGT
jgi:hypothetical protein